jgi:hypothetical protein
MASVDTDLGIIRIDVFTEQSLEEFWSPIGPEAARNIVVPGDISRICSETIELPTPYRGELPRLSAHRSPLHEGIYRIWMSTSPYNNGLPPPATVIARFHLSLPSSPRSLSANPTSSPRLQLQTFWRARCHYLIDLDISYSGHTVGHFSGHRVYLALSPFFSRLSEQQDSSDWVVDLPHAMYPVHVSDYSGALTYATSHSILVNYYE